MLRAADLGRLEAEGSGHQIDGPLHRESRFGAAGATIGGVRHLVGDDDPARRGEILDPVGAGQVHGGVVGDARADRVPGAAIDDVVVAQREDTAVAVEPDLEIVQLVARMGRAHQMLAATFDPAHRTPEPARDKGDQQILGIDMPLAAKAAADIEGDAAHPRLGHAEQASRLAAHPVHHLGRRPDRHCVGTPVVFGDHPARLHRHRGVAVVIEAALEAMRCAGHRRGGVAPTN